MGWIVKAGTRVRCHALSLTFFVSTEKSFYFSPTEITKSLVGFPSYVIPALDGSHRFVVNYEN